MSTNEQSSAAQSLKSAWQLDPPWEYVLLASAHPLCLEIFHMYNLQERILRHKFSEAKSEWDRCRYLRRQQQVEDKLHKEMQRLTDAAVARWNEEDPDWKAKLGAAGRREKDFYV